MADKVELGGIYNLPGEGFVVELKVDDKTMLFDRQGLQHRIIERSQQGLDTGTEQKALNQINSLGPRYELWT